MKKKLLKILIILLFFNCINKNNYKKMNIKSHFKKYDNKYKIQISNKNSKNYKYLFNKSYLTSFKLFFLIFIFIEIELFYFFFESPIFLNGSKDLINNNHSLKATNSNNDNLLIFSVVTNSAKQFTKNWISSIIKNNFQDNFFIIAIDDKIYKFLNSYIPKKINFTKKLDHDYVYLYDSKFLEKTNKSYVNWGTENFKKIACIRPKIINSVMKDFSKNEKLRFYRLLYVDIDMAFLKPFEVYNRLLSSNQYSKYEIVFGDDTNILKNKSRNLCSCLMYFPLNSFNNYSITINKKMNKFLENWHKQCFKRKSNRNQASLNNLLNKESFSLNWSTFEQSQFPNGLNFKTWISPEDFIYKNRTIFSNIYWMHANYHLGQEEKIMFFKKYDQWNVD